MKVVECIDLVPADTGWGAGGSSDPFVRLTLGDQINTTETVQKNLDPTFNADFHFEVSKAASRDDLKLLVEVFDSPCWCGVGGAYSYSNITGWHA